MQGSDQPSEMGAPDKNETEGIRNEGFVCFCYGTVLNNSEGGDNMAKNSVCAVAGVLACGLVFFAQAGEKQQFSSIVFGKQINGVLPARMLDAGIGGSARAPSPTIGSDLPGLRG